MRPFSRDSLLAALFSTLLVSSAAMACLWDYDTLKMERARFPSVLELITGKFLRHSPEFYKWRIQDRLERLKSDPTNVSLLDDLSVAYDKTGDHDKAIATALAIEQMQPGRYETAANLGTFYIHGGRPKLGLPYIDKALQINPSAHFGRERYQKLVVEYVLSRRPEGPVRLPLADVTLSSTDDPKKVSVYADITNAFDDFLKQGRHEQISSEEAAEAVKGILGMMKFGNYDSPILLEALGSLLALKGYYPKVDAKLLAARAFLKASYETSDASAREAYRRMAHRAIYMQTSRNQEQVSLEWVEAGFKQELDDARAWYTDLREKELSWIRDGLNPETEFDRLYMAEPESNGAAMEGAMSDDEKLRRLAISAGVVVGFVVLSISTVVTIVVLKRRRSRLGPTAGRG